MSTERPGRPSTTPPMWWRSGDAFLPPKIVKFLDSYIVGSDSSLFYVNLWSGVHFLSGFTLGKIWSGLSAIGALFIHLTWELWQMYIGMTKLNPRGLIDSIVDTIFFMVGFWMA